MKNVQWFLIGVIGGFVAAHLMNNDPRGHEILAEVDARFNDFTGIVGDAFRAEQARLTDPLTTDRRGTLAATSRQPSRPSTPCTQGHLAPL